MSKQAIIERTLRAMNNLPDDKAREISDFAEFILKRYEEFQLTKGIQTLAEEGNVFEFLQSEEDLYSLSDIKEIYNG